MPEPLEYETPETAPSKPRGPGALSLAVSTLFLVVGISLTAGALAALVKYSEDDPGSRRPMFLIAAVGFVLCLTGMWLKRKRPPG